MDHIGKVILMTKESKKRFTANTDLNGAYVRDQLRTKRAILQWKPAKGKLVPLISSLTKPLSLHFSPFPQIVV